MNVTRVAYYCYALNWVESTANGSDLLRSPGNLLLNEIEPVLEALGSRVELVHTGKTCLLGQNVTSSPELHGIQTGAADLNFELWTFRHDRYQLVDYLFPFRVS